MLLTTTRGVLGRMKAKRKLYSLLPVTVLTAFAAFFLAGCSGQSDWTEFRGAGGRGFTSDNIHPPIGVKWKLQLQTDGTQAFAFNNFVIRDNVMFFGSTDGNFYALDLETGYMRWVFKTGAPVNSIPYADDTRVYFGSNDGNVYAVSRGDGKKIWEYDTGRPIQSTVIRYQDHIIAASDGGSLFFLSLDGKLTDEIPNPIWYRDTFQVYDDIIYLARGPVDQARSLGAYDLSTHTYHWLLDAQVLNADWYSFPAISGNRLFISTLTAYQGYWQYDYYAFQRMTGQMLWHWSDFADWGNNPPADLYNEYRRNMNILDYMAPAVWKNKVIYSTGDNVVRALDARTGGVAWSHRFKFRTTSAAVIAGDRVYVGLAGSEALATPPPDVPSAGGGGIPGAPPDTPPEGPDGGSGGGSGGAPQPMGGTSHAAPKQMNASFSTPLSKTPGNVPALSPARTLVPVRTSGPVRAFRIGETATNVSDSSSSAETKPRLVCMSARNGRVIWQMDIDGALLSPPVIAGKWIVFGTDKNYVYVLEELV